MTLLMLLMLVLLLAAVCLFCGPLWWWTSARRTVSRDAVNQAFYRQRLQELACEDASGPLDDGPSLVAELQYNLLDDIPPPRTAAARPVPAWALYAGIALLLAITLGSYFSLRGFGQLRDWHRVMDNLPALRERLLNEERRPLSEEEIARLALAVRTGLQRDPANAGQWMLLGRIGAAQGNAAMAIQAWERAWRLDANNPEVALGYAAVLTQSSDPDDNRLAAQLLASVLRVDHTHLRALSLFAFNAFELRRYEQAIGAWQMMLRLLPPDDPRVAVLTRSIAQAKVEAAK
ncbi:c-type cytochrome biogenesis protein CcmI [Affinibrenneria salicis]|nr:c-type cytochrome biogenesis protein CcmI [Affinibrenneria salicis]